MNNRIRKAALARGYCCTFAAIRDNRQLNTSKLASFLGVSRDAIQYWKAKIKLGSCSCVHASTCFKKRRGGL